MTIFNNITETIGNTPIVKINNFNINANIFAKLEFFNPTSSIKDRIAQSMIEDAEQKGLIKKDTIIIEPTSGNTGIGLASVCAAKGYKLILTMPDTMSLERRKLLKIFGAELVLTPGSQGMKAAIEKANELKKNSPNSVILQQFENPANVEIHKKTTAQEIIKTIQGKIDVFVAGIGTGGTITGVGKVLKEHNPNIKIIGVEPFSSAVLSHENPGSHKIQGIGAGFVPKILDIKIYDEIIKIKDEDAISMSKQLAKSEGILAGISSGAAMWAALEVGKKEKYANKNIITIFPDTGERYLSE